MFDLYNLGWNSFQQLCLTITREVLGQTVESFLNSNDGGRDGSFTGQWNQTGLEDLSGRFVIQCKFTSRVNYNLRPSDLSDEVAKVKKLVERNLCDVYVLMTNAGLSGRNEENIRDLFECAGVKHVTLFGSTWIYQQISENQRLRMLVPRVYGLGDLTQILDERAYAQARAIIESLREDLAKVVVTEAYRKAAAALDEHSFVLLIGEPAAGKTTIASMLAMVAADQWNASMLKLDDPGKVVDHWNPHEPSQFFWLDDAFGVTQYESFLVRGWNHIFPQIKSMIRTGAKIVMTSRDYIYNQAREELKESAFPLLKESQVVIDVHDLTGEEKRQILYNHIKLGRQPRVFRSRVKPHLESVATHARFIPETARRLSDPFFTQNLICDSYHLNDFVEKRESHLQEVLQGLDEHSKAALALIFMRKDQLESPITLQESENLALERLASNIGKCTTALEALNSSLVLYSHVSGNSFWRFKHPSIGDAYAEMLVQSPELLEIFIRGSAPDKLTWQVNCGDVGIEKAVIIPKKLFPLMVEKLGELTKSEAYKSPFLSTWAAKDALYQFLARRCSKEFISLYLEENLDILDSVSEPGLYLDTVPEVALAMRLHELGLFPEEKRKKFVSAISEYAILGEDLYGLDSPKIRNMFEDHEFENLLHRVRTQLFPNLTQVRRNCHYNYDSDDPPDQHMEPFRESLRTLEKYFGDDPSAKAIIDREHFLVDDWIIDNTTEEPDRKPRDLGMTEKNEKPSSTRSIFDDVDV